MKTQPFSVEKPLRRLRRLMAAHKYTMNPRIDAWLRRQPKCVIERAYFAACAELKVAP